MTHIAALNLNSLDISKLISSNEFLQAPEITGRPGQTPIIRWAGSKKKLLPALQLAAPQQFNTYYEPFFGSGIFFLNLCPQNSVISDLNPHLIQAYEVIKEHPELLWEATNSISADHDVYYDVRGLPWDRLDEISRAARFIYLNRFCFNGVYRTNRQGGFNVSRGKGCLGIPSLDVFRSFSESLQTTNIYCADFESIVNQASAGDFVYLDPPYIDLGKRDRGEYGVDSFKFEDLERLVLCAKAASSRGANVLISYRECPSLISLLSDWYIDRLSVQRSVSCSTTKRKRASEIFLSNYIC